MSCKFRSAMMLLVLSIIITGCGGQPNLRGGGATLNSGGGGGGGGGNGTIGSDGWDNPTNLSDTFSPAGGEGSEEHDAAMDANGNAIIVWSQSDGTYFHIYKSEYWGDGWMNPSSLADYISPSGEDARYPKVAMDNNGNALITWQQYDGANSPSIQIFKSEYRNGSWTRPMSLYDNISPDDFPTYDPRVAMDNNGNAIIVWSQQAGWSDTDQIFMSEYRNGLWRHPASLSDHISPDGGWAEYPEVAMDNNGNAIIAWEQYNSSENHQVFKSEYRNRSWTHPANRDDYIYKAGDMAYFPRVVMNDNGEAIIAYIGDDGTSWEMAYVSQYRNGAWTNPASRDDHISPDEFFVAWIDVAMDKYGNAIVAWNENYRIYRSEYRNGVWTNPDGLSDFISPSTSQAWELDLVMSDINTALITWNQSDGTKFCMYKSTYGF